MDRLCRWRTDDAPVVRPSGYRCLMVRFRETRRSEMDRAYPGFERAEGMFDGLPAQLYRVGLLVQTLLHRLEGRFVFPACDAKVLAAVAPKP